MDLYKTLDSLIRHILTITRDIIYKDDTQIVAIAAVKLLAPENNTKFYFEEDLSI